VTRHIAKEERSSRIHAGTIKKQSEKMAAPKALISNRAEGAKFFAVRSHGKKLFSNKYSYKMLYVFKEEFEKQIVIFAFDKSKAICYNNVAGKTKQSLQICKKQYIYRHAMEHNNFYTCKYTDRHADMPLTNMITTYQQPSQGSQSRHIKNL